MKTLKLSVFRVVWTASMLIAVMSFAGEKLSGFLQDQPRVGFVSAFPTSVPHEENRVTADAGFSAIAPAGWKTIRRENQLLFISQVPSSYECRLRVTRLEDRYRHPAPLPETRIFQSRPAYSVERTEPAALGEPPRHQIYLVFERDRGLYELCFESAGPPQRRDAENLWSYFETFRAAQADDIAINQAWNQSPSVERSPQ